MKSLVSPQYLREEKINVTIVEVKSPVHYVIKESPSMNILSTYASQFLELEESMQKYYGSLEKTFFQLPVKDTILIVEHKKKYYRAKVCSILNLPRSYLIKVYLLDYGKDCSVPKNNLFEMHPDFMSVPFQVIDFRLPGLEPVSFVMNPFDLTVEYGTATEWDPSAFTFIERIHKALHNAFVKVEGCSRNCIFGTLHVTLPDGEEKCVNDELVFKKFASQNPESWNNITRLADIISKADLSNSNISRRGSNNSEAFELPCTNSKSLPVDELSSPESVKSSVSSTIESKPFKIGKKSGVEKLREILRAKKSQEQSRTLPSEGKKEVQTPSNAERKLMEQKEVVKKIEKSEVDLLKDVKGVFNTLNEAMKNIEKLSFENESVTSKEADEFESTVKSAVLKIAGENKCDQSISLSPNGSTLQKFKEILAKKKATQKQNTLQTLIDNSCSDCPSQIFQSEISSPVANSHSSELVKSEKCSPVLDISATQSGSVGSNLLPSATFCSEFANTETLVHQPMNSATTQYAYIAENASLVKCNNKQSVESQLSSPEQKEVSTKVDSAKVKAFYERNKKARAIFLAQKKSKQDLDNVNSQLPIAPSSKCSENETHLVDTEMISVELSGASKLSEIEANIIATDTRNVVEESCEDSNNKNLELADEPSESHCKSMEFQTSESKEIAKPRVDPGKVKKFFEQSRKTRAIFLAQTKSKQDQDNGNSLSEMNSPSLVGHKSSKTERKTGAVPEIMNSEKSSEKDSDVNILELVRDSSDSNCSSPKSDRYAESETESLTLIQQEPSESINFDGKSLFEKLKIPALCLGEGVPTPVLSLNDITFHPSIKKTLEKLGFEGPSCIQSVVWPAALRSRCIAAIAPPHSGKSVAYLFPIVSNLMHDLYNDSHGGKGPITIIICSSWKKVQHIYDLLQLFAEEAKFKVLAYFADGRSKRSRVITLMNGCDILISVPSILLNFFKENSICVNRCCHFILDDGANLLSSHMNEVKRIMGMFGEAIKLRPTISARLQILINSERWTKGVASFVEKFLREPLLLFTSFLEAAIYTQIPMFPHVCSESDKNMKLVEIVKACSKRTIICTLDINKACEIHYFLQSENVRSFLVTEEMEHYIADGVIRDWKGVNSGLPYCLIVTDPALTGLTLCDANYVIHYDVPEISRLQFGNRFGCIAEHFQKSDVTDCGSHILISETCFSQAVPILKIIKRIGMDVPKELINFVNKQKKVADNPGAPLCKYFKAFGLCKLPHCEKRHHINSDIDQPKVTFRQGDIHAKVTHMFDASHFYVRVIKYIPPNCQQSLSLSAEYAEMGLKLKDFYTIESNRKVVECPVVGGNYIFQYGNGFFYRIKVMDITETDSRKITLLFRDDGFIQSHVLCELYEDLTCDDLPPPHAVEVFLCNVATPDSCLDWNPQANHFVKKLIMDKEVSGKIVLCLGETLWLHPLVLREKLAFNNDYLNLLTVDKSLKDAEFAIGNENHLPQLFKACENKIQLPIQKSSRPPVKVIHEDIKIQVTYAFLELNVYEDVYVSSVISPHQIYVQRVKFVDCLNELLEKINAQVDAKKLKKCSAFLNGMHCIAPFSMDNRYYRALVTSVSSDSEDVHLFFVDFGDSCCAPKNSIFILPPEFTLLPFQAIECELDVIRAPHGGWSDKAADFLEDMTRDEFNDMKIMEIKAYTKLTSYESGNRYKVDVWNGEKTLSEQLLAEGLVDPADKFILDEVENETKYGDFIEEVPDGFSLSSDEDLPSENKDHHALFCAALSKMLLQNKSSSEAINEVVSELAKSREQKKFKMGIEELSVNGNVEECIKEDVTIVSSPVAALQRLLNYKKREEESKKIRPTILWWDSSEHVHVLLKLKDIQLYELDVKDVGFVFKTSVRGVDYYAEVQFYRAVHSNDYIEKNEPDGLSIVLKKQVEERWLRLIKENKKLPYIKYDLEHIDISDSEDILEDNIGVPLDGSSPVNTEMDIEEDSDITDDETSIPEWRKLAEFKDPYNLME